MISTLTAFSLESAINSQYFCFLFSLLIVLHHKLEFDLVRSLQVNYQGQANVEI